MVVSVATKITPRLTAIEQQLGIAFLPCKRRYEEFNMNQQSLRIVRPAAAMAGLAAAIGSSMLAIFKRRKVAHFKEVRTGARPIETVGTSPSGLSEPRPNRRNAAADSLVAFLCVYFVRFVLKIFRDYQERLSPFGAVCFVGNFAALAGALAESLRIILWHPC
jgi:hypothetical protein